MVSFVYFDALPTAPFHAFSNDVLLFYVLKIVFGFEILWLIWF